MREAVAVELVSDERAEHDEARRIGPQFLLQEAVDDHALHDSVAEQIKREEIVLRDREGPAELEYAVGDPVVRVLGQFALAEAVDPVEDRRRAGEVERDPADHLEDRVQPLEADADREDLVDPFLLHGRCNALVLEK